MAESNRPVEVAAGQHLGGRYQLLSLIGRGGMASVWRARDLRLRRDVAAKVHGGESQEQLYFFHREARAIAALSHRHVVQIFDYSGPGEQQAYLVMELVRGVSAQQLRAALGGRLDEPLVASIAFGVALGLKHAHRHGVLHRDLKPANVMVDGEGRVLLTDFGLAKALRNPVLGNTMAAQKTRLAGTPDYLAPEQILDQPVTPAADVFAFGSLLYSLAVGRPPFHDPDPVETMRRVATVDYEPLADARPDTSPAFQTILEACLMADAAARPNGDSLATTCRRWLSTLSVVDFEATVGEAVRRSGTLPAPVQEEEASTTQVEPPRPAPAKRPVSRRWLPLAGGLVLLVMAVTLVGLYVSRARPATSSSVSSPAPPVVAPTAVAASQPAPVHAEAAPAARARDGETAASAPEESTPAPRKAKRARVETAGQPSPPEPPQAPPLVDGPGQVELVVIPWGTVFVDGQKRGNTPFVRVLTLTAGDHRVRVEHPTFGGAERSVLVRTGQSTRLELDLRPKE